MTTLKDKELLFSLTQMHAFNVVRGNRELTEIMSLVMARLWTGVFIDDEDLIDFLDEFAADVSDLSQSFKDYKSSLGGTQQ